ncbi:MAG: beta strand repeat-containing protein, partial [bacterium]
MTTGPLRDRQSIINSQQIILSRFTVRPKKTSGTGSSQGGSNSDSVSLSDEALQAARLRDEERVKEQQSNRKEINTYSPGGNKSDANLIGDGKNNTLTGGAGNDTIDGLAGADKLIGKGGSDTYIVDNIGDVVVEGALAGNDTVKASIDYSLGANVENLTLTGSGNLSGTGNASNNVITGNSGNNTLDGGAGADILKGGVGNDTYIVDDVGDVVTELLGEGLDTVNTFLDYSLGANLENLTLTGTGNVNGTGNTLSNTITGNTGNNTLDGGAGADLLAGGAGNDTYVVDNAADVVTELSGEGVDTVNTSISYTIGANVENLTLTGTGNIDGTGSTLNNTITGNTGNNTLDGGAGMDKLVGGIGDDTYIVDNIGDIVTELVGEGTDTVVASISYSLGTNIENLTLTGTGNIGGTGNASNNVITGNSGDNYLDGGKGDDTLSGGAGNDTLDGGEGNNTLIGGAGNDTYIVSDASDVIQELVGEGVDTVKSSVTYTLTANFEKLTLTGSNNIDGTGNTDNNVITGNSGNNTLTGGDGNDILDGGGGNDILNGGTGDDTYIVDNLSDIISESANAGTDTVESSISYTLTANVENLTLTGTGNIDGTGSTLNNTITGNTGNNTLDGGLGTDTLKGGLGDDTYVINVSGDSLDVIQESVGEGADTVVSFINYSLGANVENLTLTGTGDLDGTGNTLDNVITGNTGNNTLDGGAGNDSLLGGAGADKLIGGIGNDYLDGGTDADSLDGGAGDDTYVVDNAADVVTELSGEGTDTVNA